MERQFWGAKEEARRNSFAKGYELGWFSILSTFSAQHCIKHMNLYQFALLLEFLVILFHLFRGSGSSGENLLLAPRKSWQQKPYRPCPRCKPMFNSVQGANDSFSLMVQWGNAVGQLLGLHSRSYGQARSRRYKALSKRS
jgi:hypothetical protein